MGRTLREEGREFLRASSLQTRQAEQLKSRVSAYCWPNHVSSRGSFWWERQFLRVHFLPLSCSTSLRANSFDIYYKSSCSPIQELPQLVVRRHMGDLSGLMGDGVE